MTKIRNGIGAVLAASIVIVGLSACEKKEGPGERAGKAVDKAVESTGKKIEEAGEKIQDAAKDAKK
jgi:predicted small secreted protein